MNKRLRLILVIVIMLLVGSSCLADEGKLEIFSIYDDVPSQVEEQEEYTFETEEAVDYSQYDYINFSNDKKTAESGSSKLFILQTSKDVNFQDLNRHPVTKISINPHLDDDYKLERGLSTQIASKKLKLGATYAQRSYDYHEAIENKISIIPEVSLTKNLTLKTKLSKNVDNDTNQSQLALIYKFSKNKNDLQLEIKAGATYKTNIINSQSVQFTTKFKI